MAYDDASHAEDVPDTVMPRGAPCMCGKKCRGRSGTAVFLGLFLLSLTLHAVTLVCYLDLRSEVKREITHQKRDSMRLVDCSCFCIMVSGCVSALSWPTYFTGSSHPLLSTQFLGRYVGKEMFDSHSFLTCQEYHEQSALRRMHATGVSNACAAVTGTRRATSATSPRPEIGCEIMFGRQTRRKCKAIWLNMHIKNTLRSPPLQPPTFSSLPPRSFTRQQLERRCGGTCTPNEQRTFLLPGTSGVAVCP
ncbi:hypothetical protein GOODEAATRI_003627 [Goodea atripinnis]|uniref:Uncharacterized protein n=1 Tax=Goodea atripinnis TaxID=208336 RepID=A0ABV0MYD8_9TELE